MPKRIVTGYSDEFKGMVLAEYATGASTFSLEKKYGVDHYTIEVWAKQYQIQRGAMTSYNAQQEIGMVLIEYVKKSIHAMIRVVEQVHNDEWMAKQSAGDLALLLSTMNDRTVHIISSMQASADSQRQLRGPDDHPPDRTEST